MSNTISLGVSILFVFLPYIICISRNVLLAKTSINLLSIIKMFLYSKINYDFINQFVDDIQVLFDILTRRFQLNAPFRPGTRQTGQDNKLAPSRPDHLWARLTCKTVSCPCAGDAIITICFVWLE